MLNYKQREKIAGWVYKWRELSNKLFEIKKIIPEEYSKEFSEALNESISLKMSRLLQKILSETKKDNTTDQEHFERIKNMFGAENIASIKGKGSKSFEEWKKKQTLKEYLESYDKPLNEGLEDKIKQGLNGIKQFCKMALAAGGIILALTGTANITNSTLINQKLQKVEIQREKTYQAIHKMKNALSDKKGMYDYANKKKIGSAAYWYYFSEHINDKQRELQDKMQKDLSEKYDISFDKIYGGNKSKYNLKQQTGNFNRVAYAKEVCDKSIAAYKELENYAENIYRDLSERDKN